MDKNKRILWPSLPLCSNALPSDFFLKSNTAGKDRDSLTVNDSGVSPR